MDVSLSASERLARATVRIESQLPNGSIGTGTGVFLRFAAAADGSHVPALVTNRHVVAGAAKGRFHLTLADERGAPLPQSRHVLGFNHFAGLWLPHPDPAVDLCVMPVAPLLKAAQAESKRLFYIALEADEIASPTDLAELALMEEIALLGYPNGMWDEVNNRPVFTWGMTASHPRLDWNGRPEFLIDAASFPGCSGAPVFLLRAERVKLLGILYAAMQRAVSGERKAAWQPTQETQAALSSMSNNLALVIKAPQLAAFDRIFRERLGQV